MASKKKNDGGQLGFGLDAIPALPKVEALPMVVEPVNPEVILETLDVYDEANEAHADPIQTVRVVVEAIGNDRFEVARANEYALTKTVWTRDELTELQTKLREILR